MDKREAMVMMWMRNMVSEDSSKIFALIIVALSFISIPILLFFLVVMMYFDVNEIIKFYYSRVLLDGLTAILLTAMNVVLFFGIRALIRWVRE